MGWRYKVLFLVVFLLLFNILLVSTDFVDDGSAQQNVTDCGILNTTNAVYTLNVSLTSSYDCIEINATNITLDCAGYNITFGNETGGFGIVVSGDGGETGIDNVTIRNCYLIQNESALNESTIFFGQGSENAVVYNNTIETYGNESNGIQLGDDSVNANISLNNVYTNGTNSSGIVMSDNGLNAAIEDNNVLTLGYDGSGILIMPGGSGIDIYNNIFWGMGNRTLLENAMGGIALEENTSNLNISSNLIIMGWFSGDDYDFDENETWILSGGGYDAAGIWVGGDNSTIDNNVIVSFGELGNGIFLNDVEGINITSNVIVTLGEQGHAILSEMSEDAPLLFYNNVIGTFGENSSGINLRQDWYSNISSNNISTYGNYSYGVFLNQSSNITMVNNIIETGESTSYVLYLNTSSGNLIYNNLFNTSTINSGVFINNSDPSNFNTTKTSATNIVGKSYIGGNYWGSNSGTGYSDSCTESDGDYICDSSYTLIQNMDFIDYFPLTLTTSYIEDSGDSPGGGGSGNPFWRATYGINDEQFKQGYTKELIVKSRIRVRIRNTYHYMGVLELTNTTAKINVSSNPQQATFLIGDLRRFDVTENDYYDIAVVLNGIANDKANITILSISEKVTEETINQEKKKEEATTGEEETKEPEETKNLNWLWILMALIIVVIFVGMKKRAR